MLLLLVGGLDGPGDQGRGHMAVGQDPVVEAAQAEGVAEAGLGSGPETLQLQRYVQAADQSLVGRFILCLPVGTPSKEETYHREDSIRPRVGPLPWTAPR